VRLVLAITVVGLLQALAAVLPARAEESNQSWPEFQVHYWFNEHRSRAILMGSLSRDRESIGSYQAEQGLTFEHQFAPWFLGRIGYRHGSSTDGGPFTENRLLLEQTFRVALPAKTFIDYRTRTDFRWLNDGFFVRLRERVQVFRDFEIAGYTFTPYTSAEVFFDTRVGAFNRYRLTVGSTFPIDKHVSVEPYFTRQVDYGPVGAITNALGFILTMAF
jgi:hypothetical protein